MERAIRHPDGGMISNGEWSAIKTSARRISEMLCQLEHPCQIRGCHQPPKTKTYFRKYYPAQWRAAIFELEAEQPLLVLCAANWKAEHVLGNSLLSKATNSTLGIDTDDHNDNDNDNDSDHPNLSAPLKRPHPDLQQPDGQSPEEAVPRKSKKPRQTANVENEKRAKKPSKGKQRMVTEPQNHNSAKQHQEKGGPSHKEPQPTGNFILSNISIDPLIWI
jgi:hypothetical protein